MRRFILFLLQCYRVVLSPLLGNNCRFYPSCSSYMIEAIEHYGVLKGSLMGAKRLARCHPWHEGGIDPVPERTCSHSH